MELGWDLVQAVLWEAILNPRMEDIFGVGQEMVDDEVKHHLFKMQRALLDLHHHLNFRDIRATLLSA